MPRRRRADLWVGDGLGRRPDYRAEPEDRTPPVPAEQLAYWHAALARAVARQELIAVRVAKLALAHWSARAVPPPPEVRL